MANPKNTLFLITGPRKSGKSIVAAKLTAKEIPFDKKYIFENIDREILQGDVAVALLKIDPQIKQALYSYARKKGQYFTHIDIQP